MGICNANKVFSNNLVHSRKVKIYAGYVGHQNDTNIEFSAISTIQVSNMIQSVSYPTMMTSSFNRQVHVYS